VGFPPSLTLFSIYSIHIIQNSISVIKFIFLADVIFFYTHLIWISLLQRFPFNAINELNHKVYHLIFRSLPLQLSILYCLQNQIFRNHIRLSPWLQLSHGRPLHKRASSHWATKNALVNLLGKRSSNHRTVFLQISHRSKMAQLAIPIGSSKPRQNKCIRSIIRVLNSIPTPVLCAETGIMPFQFRRNYLAGRLLPRSVTQLHLSLHQNILNISSNWRFAHYHLPIQNSSFKAFHLPSLTNLSASSPLIPANLPKVHTSSTSISKNFSPNIQVQLVSKEFSHFFWILT